MQLDITVELPHQNYRNINLNKPIKVHRLMNTDGNFGIYFDKSDGNNCFQKNQW